MISEQAAATFRGDQAAGYDARSRVGIPGYDTLHELSATLLRMELGDSARLLVVGTGTGEEIVRLAPANPRWRFVGIDPAPDMLAIAGERIAAAGATDRAELITGVIADLPPAPVFDAATLLLVMHFLPDDGAKRALLREIAVRLKPGAPLLLADLHGNPASPGFGRLLAAWRQRIVALTGDLPAVTKSFVRIQADIAFVPESRIAALLAETGFGAPLRFWSGLLFSAWIVQRERGTGDEEEQAASRPGLGTMATRGS